LNRNYQALILLTLFLFSSFILVAPIKAQNYSLTVQPAKQTIAPGMSTAYTIIITSSGGFDFPVELKVENEDDLHSSISVLISPSTVAPPPDGVGYAILTVSTTSRTPKREHTILISGRGGGSTYSASVILDVTSKSTFAIDVSPFSQTIGLSLSKEFDVTVSSLGKFDDEVELRVDRVPFGISYEFIPDTVEPTEGGSVTATLKILVDEDTDPFIYALIVRGTSDDDDEFAFAVIEVPEETEFELTITPTEETITIEKTAYLTVEATSIGGFKSEIDLTLEDVPSGVTYSFDPESIKPTPTKTDSSTLKLTVSTAAVKGDYDIDVKGSSLGIVKKAVLQLTIEPIETSLTCRVLLTSVRKDDPITVSGQLSESVEDATIKVIYRRPDGTEFTRIVKTDSDGSYLDEHKPDFTGLAQETYIGSWQVRAEYDGNDVYDESLSSPVSFDVVFPTFLEQYGLAWLVDYALYVWIIVGIIAALIILAAYAYKRKPPPPEEKPVKAGLPAVPGEKPAPALPKERAELPERERAVERITERPSERIVERVVERPVPEIKKGKKAPSLILPRRKCANCEKVISAQAKFCDNCRAPQPEKVQKKYEAPPLILPRVYCYNCGATISEKAKFCDKCKAPQKN
jgi:hypothetical protein